MYPRKSVSIVLLLLIGIARCVPDEDLLAEESTNVENREKFVVLENEASQEIKKQTNQQSHVRANKYSTRVDSKYYPDAETQYGFRTYSISKSNSFRNNLVNNNNKDKDEVKSSSSTDTVLDFRIARNGTESIQENEVAAAEKKETTSDMRMASSGKEKKEAPVKREDDEEEKTLAQQVADGKYGLIQNEIFSNGSKRPGILSYSPNSEVPKDTKENLGGLEKDEIWLAEDHVLVLKGGRYPDDKENETPGSSVWPPIDDYEAPPRQVKIPENPKIPPPFPIQLSDNGPLEIIKGENGSPLPFIPPFPPFGFPVNDTLPYPPPFPVLPDGFPNKSFPFPAPPGPLPPFLNGFPPGAAFLPPPGNLTEFDEDDPSIYYPPKYDFYYPQDNSTAVPPGPLVPGIILPPPPDFFAPLNKTDEEPKDEENETDDVKSPFVAPAYLPVTRKPSPKQRTFPKRPTAKPTTPTSINEISNVVPETTPWSDFNKPTVTYVYPENAKRKQSTTLPFDSLRTTKISSTKIPEENSIDGFTSPIYVPSGNERPVYHPVPTTSPKPNHITIPTSKTLSKEIYIVAKPDYEDKNRIEDIYKQPKVVKADKYENLRPEIHPLRSLIRPNVSVSYVGKYGHLPAATPFPFPKKPEEIRKPFRGGHFITQAPDIRENIITTPAPEINSISVTPIPVVKKVRIRPVAAQQPEIVTPPPKPSKATFYFYEEPAVTDNVGDITKTTQASKEVSTEKPLTFTDDTKKNEAKPSVQYHSTLTTSKTPIRQFLEETFHSSNVLPDKPAISHLIGSNIPNHGIYSPDIQKMKHLNYATQVPQKPAIKYHYVTDSNTVLIPKHKIKALEIENSGSTGLQNINHENSVLTTTVKPFELFTTVYKPEKQNLVTLTHTTSTTPSPTDYKNTDGPFIPSNYYATVRPDDIHFTPQDHSLVDDITKNYFTIFGQKINSASTTPLAPVPIPIKPTTAPTVSKPHSGLTYVSDNGNNYQIQQVHTTRKPPIPQNPFVYYNEKPKYVQSVTPTPRPQSHFEQYLKELTGDDQKDFIISGVLPTKTKKGKGFSAPNAVYNTLPQQLPPQTQTHLQPQLHSPSPIYINPYREPGLSQYLEEQTQPPPLKSLYSPPKYPLRYINRPKLPYRPNYSTTLRPVMDVEIQPQYVQHVSSTTRPFETQHHHHHPGIPQNLRFNHNFGQYLQEITSYTSPTTVSPVKIKNPPSNLDYYPTTQPPSNQIGFSQSQYPEPAPETKPKPISLEGDILVNYKPPRPEINPEAEIIDVQNPIQTFDTSSNFRIVDPPDLSGKRTRPQYRPVFKSKPPTYESAKDFFENLPNSGYFSPHQSSGNSFISYNLPGNGGHFYFLTPQIADKASDEDEDIGRPRRDQDRLSKHRSSPESRYPSQTEQHSGNDYANQDYLRRRRRKKP